MNRSHNRMRHDRTRNRNFPKQSRLAWAIVAGLLVQAAPAFAQQAEEEGGTEGATTELDAVTVTAQGREEDILAVPYNISAVSGETIEEGNILDSAELMRSVAGIGVVDRGARSSSVVNGIRIRGLNVDSSALGDYAVSATPTVATYVDKTPLFANFLLSDIDRVEVLRGPQGTLYGSGSLGGAVRYLLRQPELDTWDARVSLSASSVKGSDSIGFSESFMFNAPLASTLALRLNATVNDYPGVTDYRNVYKLDDEGMPIAPDGLLDPATEYEVVRDADTVRQNYGRASLLWKPSDRFDLTLNYMAQADRFGGRRGTSEGNDGWGQPYDDLELGSVQREPSARHVNVTSLEANVDLGFATLTSSTSDYNHEGDITSENTGFYAQNGWLAAYYYNYPRPMASAVRSYGENAFTQEFRLTSKPGERFDYVLGAYYQDMDRFATQDSYLRGFKRWWDEFLPASSGAVVDDQDFRYRLTEHFKETALYGELTWHATDNLQFTGGFRHFRDRAETRQEMTVGLWAGSPSDSFEARESGSRTLLKGNVSWFFNPYNQLYATVSEGTRRGGTNATPTTGTFAENPEWLTYRSDSVRNYEVGLKGSIGRMTYNVDAFYVDWKDPQVNTATPIWGFFAVLNAEKASTKGVELELFGSLGEGFNYNLGYTYTRARLDADAVRPPTWWEGDDPVVFATKGMTLPGAPEHRFNLGASYAVPLGQGLLTLRGDAYYQSESENALSLSPRFQRTLDGFALFNASATYSLDDWDFTLWLKNLGNEEGVTGIFTEQYMGTDPGQNYFGNGSKALVAQPRTVGFTVSYRF